MARARPTLKHAVPLRGREVMGRLRAPGSVLPLQELLIHKEGDQEQGRRIPLSVTWLVSHSPPSSGQCRPAADTHAQVLVPHSISLSPSHYHSLRHALVTSTAPCPSCVK